MFSDSSQVNRLSYTGRKDTDWFVYGKIAVRMNRL
jgi:hypothetical protein